MSRLLTARRRNNSNPRATRPTETERTNSHAVAALASHTVTVNRRSGNTFSPIAIGGQVFPGEAVRLLTRGIDNQSINEPDFFIFDASGELVFRRRVTANLVGNAWIDIAAPFVEGNYRLVVHAQSFPFLPTTHTGETSFEVSADAPDPPDEPPGGGILDFLGSTTGLILAGAALVVAFGFSRK